MNDKEQDPNLQAPQEANTTKHINFRELDEADDSDVSANSSDAGSDEFDNPTRKAWEELRKDQQKQSGGAE